MKRSILALLACITIVAAASILLGMSNGPSTQLVPQGSAGGPPIVREPILFYDVSGYSIAGEVNGRLSVYNDGTVSIASSGWIAPEGVASTQYLPVETVMALRTDLFLAGAASAVDNPQFATDSPITTVTFFPKPGPTAKSNTYSYWFADGAHAEADQIIRTFIEEHFPGASF